MLGLLYHHATLLVLILIVTYSAHIFTSAILKNLMMNKMSMAKIEENENGEYAITVSEQELLSLRRKIHRAKIEYHDHYVLYSLILEIDRKGEEIVDRYIDKIIGELNNLSKK